MDRGHGVTVLRQVVFASRPVPWLIAASLWKRWPRFLSVPMPSQKRVYYYLLIERYA